MSREQLKFVVVGSVDHGKSTLIGRFLYDTGSLPPSQLETIREVCEGKGGQVEFAFVLDHLEEERNRRITIDTAQTFFRSATRDYVIIDAPGHKEFLKNMITGASQASAAVVMLDVHEGLREQTRRHAYMLSLLGIRQIIVVLNKMDKVNYVRAAYRQKHAEILSVLAKVNLKPLAVVPASAMTGENIVIRSTNMSWYKGPTVLQALDLLTPPVADENLPLRLPVQDVYRQGGRMTTAAQAGGSVAKKPRKVAVGRVASGMLRQGQSVMVLPDSHAAAVATVEKFGEDACEAQAGESIGFTLSHETRLGRGQTICCAERPPRVGQSLAASVFWMSPQPLRKDESLVVRLATQEVVCRVKRIANRIDSATLDVMETDADELADTEVAEVTLETAVPMHWDSFSNVAEMGRLVLMREADIVGGGIIA